jgi:hypothetical protein
VRPIKIALLAALLAEALTDALDGIAGETIKGIPSNASSLDKIISCGWGIMHWQLGYLVHYLLPLALRFGGEGLALLFAAVSFFLVGYVNWVLLIAAILYGSQFLSRKRATLPTRSVSSGRFDP